MFNKAHMPKEIIIIVKTGAVEKFARFTPAEASRLASLLEVAEQSTDSKRDASMLDRLSRLFA